MTYTVEDVKDAHGNRWNNSSSHSRWVEVSAKCVPELVAELESSRKMIDELTAIRSELKNEPCGDALDLLWKEIILARNPDYGDWEYPGMAYRHLKAEFDDLTHQLRAQEIATINERLRTARECAEIAEEHEDDGTAMDIRDRFEVPA